MSPDHSRQFNTTVKPSYFKSRAVSTFRPSPRKRLPRLNAWTEISPRHYEPDHSTINNTRTQTAAFGQVKQVQQTHPELPKLKMESIPMMRRRNIKFTDYSEYVNSVPVSSPRKRRVLEVKEPYDHY